MKTQQSPPIHLPEITKQEKSKMLNFLLKGKHNKVVVENTKKKKKMSEVAEEHANFLKIK